MTFMDPMTADETLAEILRRRGSVRLSDDGRLLVYLPAPDQEALAEQIRTHRDALLGRLLKPIRNLYGQEQRALRESGLTAEDAAKDAWSKTYAYLHQQLQTNVWIHASLDHCAHCGRAIGKDDAVALFSGAKVHAGCHEVLFKRIATAARQQLTAAVGPQPVPAAQAPSEDPAG